LEDVDLMRGKIETRLVRAGIPWETLERVPEGKVLSWYAIIVADDQMAEERQADAVRQVRSQ
jgi:hypothetical protein